MTRIDPSVLGFRRFTLLRSLASLIDVFPNPRFRRLRVLDADAEDDTVLAAVPDGVEVVLASGFPATCDREPYGPAFDPAQAPFDAGSFHVVLAGPSIMLRSAEARREALRGLLDLTSGVLMVRLPPSGTLGELSCQMTSEFLGSLHGTEDPQTRRALEVVQQAPTSPAEFEEALGGRKACIHYLPAGDPVGGLALDLLDHFFASLDDSHRLRELLSSFHNTALTEAGPRVSPLYDDLCLVFPGRRSLPGRVARLIDAETHVRVRPGRTELAALQLVMQLEQLERRKGSAGSGAPAPEEARTAPAAAAPVLQAGELRALLDALETRAKEQMKGREADSLRSAGLETRLDRLREALDEAATRHAAAAEEEQERRDLAREETRRSVERLASMGEGIERVGRRMEGFKRLEESVQETLQEALQGLNFQLERIESSSEEAGRGSVGDRSELQALREGVQELRGTVEILEETSRAQLIPLEERIGGLQQELGGLQRATSEDSGRYTTLVEEVQQRSSLEHDLEASHREVAELRGALADREDEITEARLELVRLRERLSSTGDEVGQLRESLEKQQLASDALREALGKERAEAAGLREAVEGEKQSREEARRLLSSERDAVAEIREQLDGEKASVARLRGELDAGATAAEAVRAERDGARSSVAELQEELGGVKARETTLVEDVERLEGELLERAEAIEILGTEVGTVRTALVDFHAILEAHPILRLYIKVKAGRIPGEDLVGEG